MAALRHFVAGFSPHTRGCTLDVVADPVVQGVFPTHVGMYLTTRTRFLVRRSFPRSRGDAPCTVRAFISVEEFSPYTWGCTHALACTRWTDHVFPARVGIDQCFSDRARKRLCFPHICEDVPQIGQCVIAGNMFFPAHAGIHHSLADRAWTRRLSRLSRTASMVSYRMRNDSIMRSWWCQRPTSSGSRSASTRTSSSSSISSKAVPAIRAA